MSEQKPDVETKKEPMPQKYLERIITQAQLVWDGEKDAVFIARGVGKGRKLFIRAYKD